MGSIGGALFAVKIGSLTPASFEILVSITALAIVILGGLGSIPGVVLGALVLIGLPGLLAEFEEYRLLIYGAALDRDHAASAAGSGAQHPPQPGAPGGGTLTGQVGGRPCGRRGRSRRRMLADRGGERMTEPLLEIKGVRKQFGGLSALAGLDLHVDEGEIVSVIGPNGAGKSTLFNVSPASMRPTRETSRSAATASSDCARTRSASSGIARTFQNVHLFPNMTVLENAMVGQHCRSRSGVFGSVLRAAGHEA